MHARTHTHTHTHLSPPLRPSGPVSGAALCRRLHLTNEGGTTVSLAAEEGWWRGEDGVLRELPLFVQRHLERGQGSVEEGGVARLPRMVPGF